MAGAGQPKDVIRWLSLVEKEVASLKLETKTMVTDNISRVWASNRQKIKMSAEDQVRPAGPLQSIPVMSLSRDPSSASSSEEDGQRKKKKKREYAKVFSEKIKYVICLLLRYLMSSQCFILPAAAGPRWSRSVSYRRWRPTPR